LGLQVADKTSGDSPRPSQFQIELSMKNNENKLQPYVAVIEVREKQTGITESLQLVGSTLKESSSTTAGAPWVPMSSGKYEIRAFVISGLEDPEILSPLITKIVIITVADDELTYSYESEPFTIVLIPDTQKYWTNNGNEEIAYNQSKWIVKNRDKLNIQLVVHLGDIVDKSNDDNQWLKADKMMKILDDGGIPYIALAGNHDIGNPYSYSNSSSRNYKHFQKYFPDSRIVFNQPNLQTEKITPNGANMATHLTMGENEFFIVSMEYCPSLDVIDLVNQAIEQYKDKRIIIATHAFLRSDGTWTSVSGGGVCKKIEGTDDYSTKVIWDLVVYPHPNVFIVLSGHSSGENKRIDNNIAGNPVQQVVIDYQYRRNGGDGMLKIITFYPERDKIEFETYSPWLDAYQSRDRSKFNFDYDMN
jgi:predicted phosphodiesterase